MKNNNSNIVQRSFTSVCKYTRQVVDYDLFCKVGNELYILNNQVALNEVLKICGECLKVYTMPKVEIDGENEGKVDGEEEEEKKRYSSSVDDTEVKPIAELVEFVEINLGGDMCNDPQSSQPLTFQHYSTEFSIRSARLTIRF